jgi:hypothetical protein
VSVVAVCALLGAASTPASAGSGAGTTGNEWRLRQAQQEFLDPQAETGQHPELTEPNHAAHHRQLVQAQDSVATAAADLPAATGGSWSYAPPLPEGFNAIHVVVGVRKVLLIAGSGNNSDQFAAGTFRSYVCSATLTGCRSVPTPVDLFCAGHTLLPDGRALVGGGTLAYGAWKGAKYLYAFNFATETYQRLTPLEIGRWYPSMITTAAGKTLITGGLDHTGALTGTTELFDYRTNTHRRLTGSHKFPLYPRIHLTKKLSYFFDGVGHGNYTGKAAPGFWEPTNDSKFTPVSGLRTPSQRSSGASCFVGDLRNQDLLIIGGGSPAVDTTDHIRLSASTPRYTPGPTLKAKKMYLSCLTLPDGTVLEAGGGTANQIEAASYEVGLLKSIGSQWQSMNPIPDGNHRLYHSSLFLLDDGRVISFGSNPKNQQRSTTVLIYSPPYLYRGTRPAITTIPTFIKRYSTITVSTTGGATRLTLTKPPAPTHGSEPNDGYMSFPIVNGKVDLSLAWARYLPPGKYRAWAVNANGAVSTARWVHLT